MDVRSNPDAAILLRRILQNAQDSAGNYIVADTDNTTTRATDKLVARLVTSAGQNSATALSAADRQLVNAALSSSYGQAAIDAVVDGEFDDLIAIAQRVAGLGASPADRTFLDSNIAKLFIIDYANQYGISKDGALEKFIAGNTVSGIGGSVRIDGSLGIGDLLDFYLHREYSSKNPVDPLRRFSRVVAEVGYTPADPADARDDFSAATYFLHRQGHLERIRNATGGQDALNAFVTNVLNPARATLLADLQARYPLLAS
jgi:hypothetical protein